MSDFKYFQPSILFDNVPWIRIPFWLLSRTELDISDKVIYGVLIWHAWGRTYCWPFMKYMAELTGLSEKTVERSTRRLEEVGLIEIERPEDRRNWTREQISKVETTGNRYFFRRNEWIPSKVFEGPEGMPDMTRTDSESVQQQTQSRSSDRLKVGRSTDSESAPLNRSLRESLEEEVKKEDIAASPSRLKNYGEEFQPEDIKNVPNVPNGDTENLATDEVAPTDESVPPGGWKKARPDHWARPSGERAGGSKSRAPQGRRSPPDKDAEPPPSSHRSPFRAGGYSRSNYDSTKKPSVLDMRAEGPELARLAELWVSKMTRIKADVDLGDGFRNLQWGQTEHDWLKSGLDNFGTAKVVVAISYLIENWDALTTRRKTCFDGPIPKLVYLKGAWAQQVFHEATTWHECGQVVHNYRQKTQRGEQTTQTEDDNYLLAKKRLAQLGITRIAGKLVE